MALREDPKQEQLFNMSKLVVDGAVSVAVVVDDGGVIGSGIFVFVVGGDGDGIFVVGVVDGDASVGGGGIVVGGGGDIVVSVVGGGDGIFVDGDAGIIGGGIFVGGSGDIFIVVVVDGGVLLC